MLSTFHLLCAAKKCWSVRSEACLCRLPLCPILEIFITAFLTFATYRLTVGSSPRTIYSTYTSHITHIHNLPATRYISAILRKVGLAADQRQVTTLSWRQRCCRTPHPSRHTWGRRSTIWSSSSSISSSQQPSRVIQVIFKSIPFIAN